MKVTINGWAGPNQRLKLTGAAILLFPRFNVIAGGPGSLAWALQSSQELHQSFVLAPGLLRLILLDLAVG